MKLVLASSSPYRLELLQRLHLPLEVFSPGIDESAKPGENTEEYVSRLSLEKARAAAPRFNDSLVIGSDQACTLNGLILGKPGTEEAAFKHLKMCSGNWVQFHTGLALVNTATGGERVQVEPYQVKFRQLEDEEIRAYIQRDMPLDCAGCFKIEESGIALFSALEGEDFHSLLGLPMITLVSWLIDAGLNPLLAPGS